MLEALFCGCRAGHLEQIERESGLINNHTYPFRSLSLFDLLVFAPLFPLYFSLSLSLSHFFPFPFHIPRLLCRFSLFSYPFSFFFPPFPPFPLRLIRSNEFERKLNQSLFVTSEHRLPFLFIDYPSNGLTSVRPLLDHDHCGHAPNTQPSRYVDLIVPLNPHT